MDRFVIVSILLGFGVFGLYLRHFLNRLQSLIQSNNESYNSRLSDITDTLNDHDLMIKSWDITKLDEQYEHLDRALLNIKSEIAFLKIGEDILSDLRSEIASLKLEIELSRSMFSRRS